MGNFDRGNRGGGRDFRRGGGRDFAGAGRDRQMFVTTCSNCGKTCEVPFKPTGSKPVYCSDCFKTMGGGDRDRRPSFGSRNDNAPRPSSDHPQYREQFEALNAKLDKIIAKLYSETPSENPAKSKKLEDKTQDITSLPEAQELTPEEPTVVKMKKRSSKKAAPVATAPEPITEEVAETILESTPEETV